MRASATRGRPTCLDAPAVRRPLDEAVRDFTQANAKDPGYLPSRINLASAHILAGQNAQALAAAEQALALAPEDPQAVQAKALSLFLYGEQSHIDTADYALALLSELKQRHPENAGVCYNLAVLLEGRGRIAAAREAFQEYLALEPSGPFAEAVRRRSGAIVTTPAAAASEATGAQAERTSPFPLGEVQAGTAKRLVGLRSRSFEIGRFGGTIYDGGGLKMLQVDDSIEIVEETVSPPAPLQALGVGGAPPREIQASPGRTLFYTTYACDVADDTVIRRIFFSR